MIFTKPPILIATLCLLFFSSLAAAQSAPSRCTVPAGFLCITQAEANAAASNARELSASRSSIETLKAQLVEKDKIIEDERSVAAKNVNDLKATLSETEVKLGTATGQIIECRADKTMYTSLIEYLTKNQRSKQNGLINIKLGGN